ncbi:vacuolar protein-sorting-associated protein 33 homolog isoform X2 [Macadamia integrifolia]|uniref:vacuolar protein-sorting-associated protein 33 homolog isoform X2 n=1 Tax=Macadamia integrifolia TaxID=60698 RepID=UPI001C52C904|nr:vacuolar protein-sorting-associated protein 33 homolog isoform X2 [Macadamia integrifolia]
MAQIPNLDNAPLNLTSLREQSQKELLNILKNFRGKKCLVFDPKLGASISLVVPASILKEHGVELRHLSTEPVQTECTRIIYLVRSHLSFMKLISSNIQHDISKGIQREYSVYFVPRRTVACEKILEEENVHRLLSIGEYPLYVIPLDEDVLSFELDLASKELQVDGDASTLWHIAKAIHKLEVDMVTPMCSQLTYEGLLDEFLRINNGSMELDASIMGIQQEGKKVKVPLNSSDKLFKETRDLNFEVVGQVLRQKATSMKQDYADMTTTSQTVSELKDFVKKLNSLPEMTRHINLAQHLSTFTSKPSFLGQLDIEHTIIEGQSYDICFEYIEELIHKQEPIMNVLRLLVLFSITNLGLPKKNYDYFRRELLHSYGFEHMATLNNLEKAGLFKKQDTKTNWPTIKRALQLIVDDTDTANPNDIAYVFSGYAPLSIRLVQHAVRSGWRPIEEILKLLPGPHLESRRGGYSSSAIDAIPSTLGNVDKVAHGQRSLVLVVFIGGVTFAEISALRFLSSQEGMAYDLIIGTTKMVNGRSLVETFVGNLS